MHEHKISYPDKVKTAPLDSIRVLDFTRVLSGPFCTALMADIGAEVIKIESPKGDDYRHVPPFQGEESAFFLLNNRGKKSIVLDLKSTEGLAAARDLIAQSDVVVENFKPGVMARLGLDYEACKEIRPDIIYASISGFGQVGPMAGRPAYDIIVQAATGLMAATGFAESPPTLVGEPIADLASGVFAAWAISSALFQRERTGQGRYIDIAMFDCVLSLLPNSIAQWHYGHHLPFRTGNRHPLSVPFGTYRAADGQFVLAILNDQLFRQFLSLIGRADLRYDVRLGDDQARSENEAFVRELIEGWSLTKSVDDLLAILSEDHIPAGPIWTIAQAMDSPHVRERQCFANVDHPSLGSILVPEQPVRFEGLARGNLTPPPLLGQHSNEFLSGRCAGSDGNDAAEGRGE